MLWRIIGGLRNRTTTIFGSIPGLGMVAGEIMDAFDDSPETVFEFRLFMLGVGMALAFLFAADAPKAR